MYYIKCQLMLPARKAQIRISERLMSFDESSKIIAVFGRLYCTTGFGGNFEVTSIDWLM